MFSINYILSYLYVSLFLIYLYKNVYSWNLKQDLYKYKPVICLYINLPCIFVFQHMKRTGWVKRNIPDPETIAGHMYRMAMLSFLVDGKENLDKTK